MATREDCWTCEYLRVYEEGLKGADQILFGALQSPVVSILGLLMTAVFMFSTQIRHHFALFKQEWAQRDWFLDFYANMGRLAVATLALGSYSFWKEWVVGTINLGISTVATAVVQASKINEIPAGGGAFPPAAPPSSIFSASQGVTGDLFQTMMFSVYQKSYEPIGQLLEAFAATGFSFTNLGGQFLLGLSLLSLSFFAALGNIMFFLILAMHKTMTVFVVGMGPLIIALWVFEKTKPYAYAMIRFLLATGSVVIGASFLVGMSLAVIASAVSKAPMIDIDGVTQFEVGRLNDWVFSPKFVAMFGSYVGLSLMMLIAVFIGVTTVLAQRPRLET